jgi:hypothetical protein
MKKPKKQQVGEEYYLLSAAVVSPLNIAQTLESIFIQGFGLS